mgnify:FL=1
MNKIALLVVNIQEALLNEHPYHEHEFLEKIMGSLSVS